MEKKFKLEKSFLDKWIFALRSGKYQQMKGELYYRGKYCAWGVACEANDIKFKVKDGVSRELFSIVWGLNDTESQTFPQIADWLEQNIQPI